MLKRTFDILFSIFGCLFFLPLWIMIPLAIYIEDRRPMFFLDVRLGKNKKPYKHFKFRSMVKEAEGKIGPVWAKKDDRRITKVGRLLRATAMDELPQLVNILRGDMSFVGPRPERPEFVAKFQKSIPDYNRRLEVRPGLTGIAQVYGKYNTTAEKKLNYDLEYIDKMSLFLDIKLVLLSILITLRAGWSRFE